MAVRARPGATAGDLLRAWPAGTADLLLIDGRVAPPDASLRLARGSTVQVADRLPPPQEPVALVVGGPLPPAHHPLRGDQVLVGSGSAASVRLDHPSVAPAHALLERGANGWTVASLDGATSVNGAAVHAPLPLGPDALLAVGDVLLQVLPPMAVPPTDRPVQPYHRPPRPPTPPRPAVPEPPEPPTVPDPPAAPGWASLVLPVAVGAVLAVAVHPTAGLFAAATPVLALGSWLDGRRRHRRDRRRADAAHAEAVAGHQRATADRAGIEAARRRAEYPAPGTVLRRAVSGTELWGTRGPELEVGVGWTAEAAPVTVRLGPDQVVGIAGPLPWAEAVARAVVAQAAVRIGPADLALDVPARWARWARWLPHVLPGGRALVAVADRVDRLPERCASVLAWPTPIHPALLGEGDAERVARALARWSDDDAPAGLPDAVDLGDLIDGGHDDGRATLRTPIGVGEDGVVVVDLVVDGPHALVAGTTGAGKSELLRSWVIGLALRHPPTAVAFVLVDYKGGSAFDGCAPLPHVAGVVTDLDAGLGHRLLVSLGAEVRDRERRLREAGVADLRLLPAGPPPRLVVVVDEFATLAAELPDVLHALVDVARRGRSLGLHLVLATQRPAGPVSDDIRANTNLRLCLRTVDPADSQDVLGGPEAASLPGDRPGRAWLRVGSEPAAVLQVARPALRAGGPPVEAWVEGDEPGADASADALVEHAVARWAGIEPPPPVWCPPLPDRLDGGLGLVDRPAERRQDPLEWEPTAGAFAVCGTPGSGRTTALLTAVTLAAGRGAHVYAVDAGRDLGPIACWPHTAALVPAHDRAALRRVVGRLASELARRRDQPGGPLVVLVVDGIDRVVNGIDDLDGVRLLDDVATIATAGPPLGVTAVLAAATGSGLPVPPTVVLALDDPAAYGVLGLRPPQAARPPGRGLTLDGLEVQLALPGPPPAAPDQRPDPVGPLPASVPLRSLTATPGRLVIGVRDRDLRPATLAAVPGSPIVVAGPPRSGRTTALDLLRLQLDGWTRCTIDELPRWLADPEPAAFLLDDAERLPDPDGLLAELVRCRHPDALVVVGVRADALRSAYGWLAELRPADLGLALHPDPIRDLACWAAPIPPIGTPPHPPGRGVLVDHGVAEVVHVAHGPG